MKILVVGSGLMGSAAAFDLARSPGVEKVTIADQDPDGIQLLVDLGLLSSQPMTLNGGQHVRPRDAPSSSPTRTRGEGPQ